MANENARTAVEVFWKLHAGLPKQGPGSDTSTRRALALVPDLPPHPAVLDLGCGPGRQTLVLARETAGHVTAVDALPPFLQQLEERAREAGLAEHITCVEGRMESLAYEDESFDLVWSEGAIYNIGFAQGLAAWRRLLRPGASLAISEATWLSEARPARVRRFWEQHYPAMQRDAANRQVIERQRYRLLGSFVLPEAEWWDDYYSPIALRLEALRGERSDRAWREALDAHEEELSMLREGAGSFGYVFYVMQRPAD